jgi:large subunit ribosomal protein L35
MPKQKTRKSVAKRFKKTASGRIKRSSSGRGHLFTNKSAKQKRRLRAGGMVADVDVKRLIHHLPK